MFSIGTIIAIVVILVLVVGFVTLLGVAAAAFSGGRGESKNQGSIARSTTSGIVDPGEKSFVDNAEALQEDFIACDVRLFAKLLRYVARGNWLALREEATELFSNLRDKEYRAEQLVLPLTESHATQLLNDDRCSLRLQKSFREQGWELSFVGKDVAALGRRRQVLADEAPPTPAVPAPAAPRSEVAK